MNKVMNQAIWVWKKMQWRETAISDAVNVFWFVVFFLPETTCHFQWCDALISKSLSNSCVQIESDDLIIALQELNQSNPIRLQFSNICKNIFNNFILRLNVHVEQSIGTENLFNKRKTKMNFIVVPIVIIVRVVAVVLVWYFIWFKSLAAFFRHCIRKCWFICFRWLISIYGMLNSNSWPIRHLVYSSMAHISGASLFKHAADLDF